MDLDKLREQDDDVLRFIDAAPLSKQLRMFQVLKARGITSDDIDHRIISEFKRENP